MSTNDTDNLRAWVESWGRELTWTDHAGAKAGSISKQEMLDLLDGADDRAILLGLLRSLNINHLRVQEENERLRAELEKSARVGAYEQAIGMLRMCATDPGAAKNYVALSVDWDQAIAPGLPFRRAQVVFVRDGAKLPAELASEALRARDHAVSIGRGLVARLKHEGLEGPGTELAEHVLDDLAKTPDANTIELTTK